MDEKRRTIHSHWKSNTRENKTSQDRNEDSSTIVDSLTVTKAPITLLKPRRKPVTDVDEEWPAVGTSIATSRVQQPQQQQVTQEPPHLPSDAVRAETPTATSFSESSAATLRNEQEVGFGYKIKKPEKSAYQPSAAFAYTQHVTSRADNFASSHYHKAELMPVKPLRGGIRLVTESMEWCEAALDYLTDQPDFLVVGIIGPQGAGKSTLLSMIGGNDPFDMYRQYIFRPASKDCTETASHQTQGVQFYVTENRTILLDSQAILSPSVMNFLISNERRYNYDFNTLENYVEVESIQIVSFLMQVCHVLVVLVDYFIDVNLLNFIRTCEMVKPSLPLSENPSGSDHCPHVVFVHNRAKKEDFAIEAVKRSAKTIEFALQGSSMLYTDSVSMKFSSYPCYKSLKDCAANFYVLPEMKPRGYKPDAHSGYKGVPDFEVLVRRLRNQLSSLPRPPFSPPLVGGEKSWMHHAARLWDLTRKSLLINELGRMLP